MVFLTNRLQIHVKRGDHLAFRNSRSCNSYVVIKMGHQKWKSGVMKNNANPEWNEELIFHLENPHLPLQLIVYNKGKFSLDEKMGEAEFSISPFLDAVMRQSEALREGDIITAIEPNRQNCMAEESRIVWKDGNVVQNMFIRLNNIHSGEVEIQLSMEYWWGLLKIHVYRGLNLAIRDGVRRSSDPYLVLKMGKQQVKTRVVKQSVNPEWDEELTLYIPDPPLPVQLFVYDRDTFSSDDRMGEAELDINPIVEALTMMLEDGIPDRTTLRTILPNRQNRLAERSQIVWENGQMVQNMVLRLKHVESGEVELQLRLKLPNS